MLLQVLLVSVVIVYAVCALGATVLFDDLRWCPLRRAWRNRGR